MKKILFLSIVLLSLVACSKGESKAEEQTEEQTEKRDSIITYTTSNGNIVDIYYKNFLEATITSNIYGHEGGKIVLDGPITRIGFGVFDGREYLTSITIPNGVKEIGIHAFKGCSSLTSVTIPNSVTSIGHAAFRGTALSKNPANWENGALYIDNCLIEVDEGFAGHFRIKENTRVIADHAFDGCSALTSVSIPNSVKSIGKWAFNGCTSLTSVTIPNGVTSIGEWAFGGCESLTSVSVPSHTTIGYKAFPSRTQIIRK